MSQKIVVISDVTDVEHDIGLKKLVDDHMLGGDTHHTFPFSDKYLFQPSTSGFQPVVQGYLFINANTIKVSDVYEEGNWDVIVVSDRLFPDNYPPQLFDEKTLVIYHSRPESAKAYLNTLRIGKSKQGAHEVGAGGYNELINIFKTYNEQKDQFIEQDYKAALNKFVKWFDKNDELEAKLALLHEFLFYGSMPSNLPEEITREEDRETFAEFLQTKNELPPSDAKIFYNEHYRAILKNFAQTFIDSSFNYKSL